MVTDSTSQADDTTAFLRAARSGNLEKVVEFLDTDLDINTANSNGLNALHLASKDGHVEIVTELLKRSAKVDAATKKGNTALHIASLAGQHEIVNILIQYGAAVNIQSQNGFTPLYMAAQENHDQVVKLLLSNGANQSLATEDGFTPLAVAMQQGHDKVVSVLLENDSKGKVRLPALHIAAKKDDCKAADLLLQNDHKPDVTSKSGFTPLHIAAHYGNEEIARLLIKRGADVNYLAKHNISPLHVAAKWGKNNMVKVLLENSAQIDAKTRDGLTPLHCAARSGHEQVVTTLLENSAPISARTKNGLAPLHMASQGDHVDAARVLLYHRAPVDEVTIDYLTSLHVAAHCGHVRVAKLLLDRKADPNARALNGFTPLHIACKKNRIKVVELLLKHGASIESTTESGLTPLHVASFMGCMNIVIFLLQHEANPDVPTVRGETPLHLAARANQTDIIRILLRNGAKVDARAREQQTPLHIASRLGNIDIVMLLLQHGAAVDTTTKDMYTALHIAAKEGQEEVATILVENNASLKATTKNGFTPLHIAAKYGNMNVAKILLQKDSKLDAQGKNDITPLHLSCHYDHPNVANLLLEKGASPHLPSQNGHTPLHIAARKNQMDIASTLLENGANANAESKAGFTPLHLSAQKGHYDMTNLLIEHGADPNHKAKNGLTALHLCAQEDFIRVASILVKNGANVESQTETGYRPIHVAAHFGNLSTIRFLLKHNADIDVKTNQNYTPLHQAAQQGHANIVTALIEGNASHKACTNDGLTALNIAQKLGYISVMEVLKGLSYDTLTPDNKNWEEKYKVIAPESLQETSFMSDSDDEGGSDALISEQPYRYLTADLMKSLRDDSLPIDVTRDDPVHRQVTKEEKQEFTQSNNYCLAENFDSTDGLNLGRLHFRSFLVSFLVDARGGAMKGCRHSGVRIIVPSRRATMPIRVTCRLVRPSKVANPPPLMEGEALATRIIEMGPVGATFLGPVLIDIPHFASIRGKEREIIILRSENGETWKEHDNSADNDDTLLNTPFDPQMSATHSGRITRIITTDFPQYFAIVTRIKQEVHVIGAEGGILISSVADHVQAVFPPGALTKKIKVGLQAHVIPAELTAKLLGNCVAVSPVITIEPRRRKFHKPITLTIPVPQAANKGMINQYGGETPTLRLLCSIAGGTSESQWEDVTGSTPLTFMNDRVSFTTTVSARFWLMDCRNIGAVPKMATELYEESLFVPYITNFVIYSKRLDILEATLRILCMTDGKEGMHTLERQEEFLEIVKSRDVEALDGKDLYIEFSGNLIPVTKSGVQLKFTFKAFRQNRLSFHVKVKDPLLDPVARMLFMREPKIAKGEPPQQPICVLNIVLPEIMSKIQIQKDLKDYEDSNIITQKMDSNKFTYKMEQKEKCDEPKQVSPTEEKFITDTLQKKQTDAVTIHESFAQKAASPLESVDASYPNKIVGQEQDLSPTTEKQTYSEKRKFWEDISKRRESYQRSESEVSRTSQLTINESDSEYLQNVVSEEDATEVVSEIGKSETMEDLNVPDISECSVAEKAHYFEEQIQKELTKVQPKVQQQDSVKSEKERPVKAKLTEKEKLEEKEKDEIMSKEIEKVDVQKDDTSEESKEAIKDIKQKEIKKSIVEEEKEKDESKQTYTEYTRDIGARVTEETHIETIESTSKVSTHVISQETTFEKAEEPKKLKSVIEETKTKHEVKSSDGVVQQTEITGTLEDIIKERKDRSGKVKEFIEDDLTEETMGLPASSQASIAEVVKACEIGKKDLTPSVSEEEKHVEVIKPARESPEKSVTVLKAIAKDIKEKEEESEESEKDISVEERSETPDSKSEDLIKGKSSGRRIITEETTIIYKVQKDGSLVQEQVLKSVQVEGANGVPVMQVPEVSVETKVFEKGLPEGMYDIQSTSDIKTEPVALKGVKREIQEYLEGERKVQEEHTDDYKPALEEKTSKTESIFETIEQLSSAPKTEEFGALQKVEQVITKQIAESMKESGEEDTTYSTEKLVSDVDLKHIKKEFESRIPISMAKADKDKAQKETKIKIPPEEKQSPEKSPSLESSEVTSPISKKKEFESRIPKRVMDTKPTEKVEKKDTHVRKESGTYTITEKKSSEEVTSKLEERSTTKSETFSKTFTDPREAFNAFENMGDMKKDFATVTSKVDHKTSSTLEKKEVVSSEISTGGDKIITHEEKESVEKKKSSELKIKKESPEETMEEKKSKREEIDRVAVQKMSLNLADGQEVIDASASESRAENKKEESFKMLEDKEGVITRETGSRRHRESDADVAIRIKKDISEGIDDKDATKKVDIGERVSKAIVDSDKIEMIAQGESHKETRESFDETQFVPKTKMEAESTSTERDVKPEGTKAQPPKLESLEERQKQKFKEIEARTVAESLIQAIESKIENISPDDLKPELLSKEYLEQLMAEGVEPDHQKLADDLTRMFENIMKKSADEQTTKGKMGGSTIDLSKSKSSIQEELFEKGSTRDSISISEDITKDEESSLHDKEESLPLSSSLVRLQDRDITMSPSSMSEQIDFEETIDVDTNELEDISKPTLSPQSEKHRSDRSSGQVEPLQRDSQGDASFCQDRILSEVSGARVLEILEPALDSQSRQDSVDVPSLEMDEHKISEQTSKGIPSLHESAEVDSLDRITLERDITISPSTVSEDTNVDYSLVHEHPPPIIIPREYDVGARRADSFEIESPPLVSPRLKAPGLEIKPVDWMIGDEKIEISEVLQPSQVFNQELEAYESSMREQGLLPSQDGSTDLEQESGTKSSEDISVIESFKETEARSTKFTVIPVSDQDFESELIENKLDISCQELVDTLQREYEARTPTEDIGLDIREGIRTGEIMELRKESVSEDESQRSHVAKIEDQEITHVVTNIIVTEDAGLDTKLTSAERSPTVSQETVTIVEPVEKSEKSTVETREEPKTEIIEDLKVKEERQKISADVSKPEIELKLDITTKSSMEEGKLTEETVREVAEADVSKTTRVDDVLKEWTGAYLSKMKPSGEDFKRHMEKTTDKHDKPGRSSAVPSDTCAFKIKKEDLICVDLSARYAITVLDQVVKKEIAEVKESLEAARQDLIDELCENSETVFQIKDSPSEFQFKLQPESIPNDLPFLYRPSDPDHPHPDHDAEPARTESPVAKPRSQEASRQETLDPTEIRIDVEDPSTSSSIEDSAKKSTEETPVIETEKSEIETIIAVHDDLRDDDEGRPSPLPASRSGSDVDNKDESSSLAPPHPVPRRRHKPSRIAKRVTSDSDADLGSSSGESSNYQSCDYEIGSGSRPSSSDMEAMQSCGVQSATASEYETAMMSIERSSPSRPTSQEYHTAATTMSSRESMKSLNSLSSGHLGSIDSTSELSETLVPSEAEADKEEIEANLECAFEEDHGDQSESAGSDIPVDETDDNIDDHTPSRMKRSSEMIFPQIIDDNAPDAIEKGELTDKEEQADKEELAEKQELAVKEESADEEQPIADISKGIDSATSAFAMSPGPLRSVDIMTSRVSEDGVQSVCTQVISTQVADTLDSELPAAIVDATLVSDMEMIEKDMLVDAQMIEPDSLESKEISSASGAVSESPDMTMQTSILSMMQQGSMSTSSTSGMSVDTVIEKEKSDRHSPDSDSFELVDKPDIIDDFLVIEEVGREAEEYDSEGKSIRISSLPQVTSKNYDRDLENLITENKEDSDVSTSQASRNNELFDFESEESPPQISNDDQYSQSYSDDEQYKGSKKWMQYQADPRVYGIEYDRGLLEDIKEEEITDFEAGSSRFGSLGSHKESIGSVGSMRGSFGSTPEFDVLAGKKHISKPDHDNVSLSSLQEFEHLEHTVAAENSKRAQCGSQDSINNGSLPRRYATSKSGHGDDISLSSLKDFEGLERACRDAHLIELRAREEEDLLEHESPENKYKLENLPRTRPETSAAGSFNPSTSGSDDYEKRIKEIDEIIRIAQSNVEKCDRQDDTTEDISQIEITDGERLGTQAGPQAVPEDVEPEDIQPQKESNIMETSTDSLELEDNEDKKHHPLCRSSDSLEMKTTLDFPSLSSDSLNNVRDSKEMQLDMAEEVSNVRRISSDSLDMPLLEQPDVEAHDRGGESGNNHSERVQSDNSLEQTPSTETNIRNGKSKPMPSSGT